MEQLDTKLVIRDIYARKIIDCEGNFTIETEVLAEDGGVGRVSVPSGTAHLYSRTHERDWTEKAVETVNIHIAPEISEEMCLIRKISTEPCSVWMELKIRMYWERRLYTVCRQLQQKRQLRRSRCLCTDIWAGFRQNIFRFRLLTCSKGVRREIYFGHSEYYDYTFGENSRFPDGLACV